jgi:Auxiliary Activity family 9 (formerly GH61)
VKSQPVTITLPAQVSPGGYLVRHEIIALQLAVSLGGAEFYPSCTQILVGGSQTGTPNQTVSFPGAYNDNDPGIYDPDVYDNGSAYIFPGPPLSNLASGSSGTSSDGGSGSPATTATSKPTSTSGSGNGPTSQPTSSKAICELKKRGTSLTRRGMGIAQHKRRVGFMRAIRDAFHYS